MPSYEHNKLVERIEQLSVTPDDFDEYSEWIKSSDHLKFLAENSKENLIAIYACSREVFIHAVVVHESKLNPLDKDDLLSWNQGVCSERAGYVTGGGRSDVWIDASMDIWGSETLRESTPLGFVRTFEGQKESDCNYFELLQEYSHLTGIHWCQDRKAYCCFDENGDFVDLVSVTTNEADSFSRVVSFKRKELEEYLAASNCVLVRMFDFMLLRWGQFEGWPKKPEAECKEDDGLFYRQKVDPGKASYTRGVQIIGLSRSKQVIFNEMGLGLNPKKNEYCVFLIDDFRNGQVIEASTDPSETTNYFRASDNSLPFETSPAFFRPDVLARYKTDRDKYTINEEHRLISCRGGWELKSYDVNEAGQVYAYICDLRHLPPQEQQYWKSFNETPKASISRRSLLNDFKGEPSDDTDPIVLLCWSLKHWKDTSRRFWQITDANLFERVNTPRTGSRDEWADALEDLSKLVVEGFDESYIRRNLDSLGVSHTQRDKSISLLEKFLAGKHMLKPSERLTALREIQEIRSRVSSHSRGSKAALLSSDALSKHGSYTVHFESVCTALIQELKLIEEAFS